MATREVYTDSDLSETTAAAPQDRVVVPEPGSTNFHLIGGAVFKRGGGSDVWCQLIEDGGASTINNQYITDAEYRGSCQSYFSSITGANWYIRVSAT